MRSKLSFTIVYRQFSDRKQIFIFSESDLRPKWFVAQNFMIQMFKSIQKLVNYLLFIFSKSFWLFCFGWTKTHFWTMGCTVPCSMFIVQLRLLIWNGIERNRYETAMVFRGIIENFECSLGEIIFSTVWYR